MLKANKEQVLKYLEACKANCETKDIEMDEAFDNIVYYLDEIKKIVKSEK
jgi:hypothetical protein